MTVPHSALCRYGVGECLHIINATVQYGDFETVVVIEMDVQRGNRQRVMVVLGVCQSLGEVARPMLVNIGKRGKTMRAAALGRVFVGFGLPDQIAYCLGAAGVAMPLAKLIHFIQQVVVDGDGDALHR